MDAGDIDAILNSLRLHSPKDDEARKCIDDIERNRRSASSALVELPDGSVNRAELHWYEAHGIGRRDMKIKYLLD